MKVRTKQHYIEKLAELYPEIERDSIQKIINIGNKYILKGLRTPHALFRFSGKFRGRNKVMTMFMYKYNQIGFNNKHKLLKRLKDARTRTK
ncbi:MAG: hypothetical protein KAH32_05170 [Chlamydiia bacterium]|nr:hypothetical protein [Chlamydiia bacterium]